MNPPILQNAARLWEKMSREAYTGQSLYLPPVTEAEEYALRQQLELYRKLFHIFQVGDCYYFTFTLPTHSMDYISPEIEAVLGYSKSSISTGFFLDKIHPDDQYWFLNYEHKAAEFYAALPYEKLMKYKIRTDYRVKKANGTYIRVLQQIAVLSHNGHGGILQSLIVHTDITYLKPEGRPVLSFIGMEGEPSFIDVDVKQVFKPSAEMLTRREKSIITLLIEGHSSKLIASALSTSKQTVDTQRKRMLKKFSVKNTSELVALAIQKGWI